MKVVSYLLSMLVWNGILRVGSLKLDGLGGLFLAFVAFIVTILSTMAGSIYLFVIGNFLGLLYFLGGLVVLDFLGSFYFRFLGTHDIYFLRENGKKKLKIRKREHQLGLHEFTL